jgi:hypothetical protein
MKGEELSHREITAQEAHSAVTPDRVTVPTNAFQNNNNNNNTNRKYRQTNSKIGKGYRSATCLRQGLTM